MTQENRSASAVKPVNEKNLKQMIFAAIILVVVNLVMLVLPFCEVYQPTRKVTSILGTVYEGWHLSRNSLVSVLVGIPVAIGYIITLIKWCRGAQPNKIYANRKAVMSKKINKFILLKISSIFSVVMPIFLYTGANSSVSSYKEYGAYCNFTFFGVVGIITNIALFVALIYLSGASKSLYIHSLVDATKATEQGNVGDVVAGAAAVGSAAAFSYAATYTAKVDKTVIAKDSEEIPAEQTAMCSEKRPEQEKVFDNTASPHDRVAQEFKTVGSAPNLVSKIIPGTGAAIGKATGVVGCIADKTVEAFKAKKWLRIAAPIAAVIILLAIIVPLLSSDGGEFTPQKTDEELIRERIDTFLTAYNDGDMEEVLNCLDAKSKNTFNALLNVMGGLAGGLTGFSFDLRDLFSLGVAVMDGYSLHFDISGVETNGGKAVATATMNTSPTEFSTVYISLIYENDAWYIQDISDNKPIILGSGGSDSGNNSGSGNSSGSNSVSYLLKTYSTTNEYGNAGTYTEINSNYSVGETVELKATVTPGYNFEGWFINDICVCKELLYSFTTKNESIELEARWSYYTVTVESNSDEYGNAGTYTKKNRDKISVGENVTLTATVADGYNFEGWYIDGICVCAELTYRFVMGNEDKVINAKYSYYTLTTDGCINKWSYKSRLEDDAGTYTKYNEEKISNGEVVTLVATLGDGYTFKGWYIRNVCVSTDLEYTYTMTRQNVMLEARYTYYTLTVEAYLEHGNYYSGFEANMGSYTQYDEEKIRVGETVTLIATEKEGYEFLGWKHGNTIVSEELIYTFTMVEKDDTYKAIFKKI